MKKIIVIGGGGHAKVVISILKKLNNYSIVGYTDVENKGNILGIPYLGTDRSFTDNNVEIKYAVIGIGQIKNVRIRKKIIKIYKKSGVFFPSIVSPNSIINEEVKIGNGTVIMDGVVINCETEIGDFCIVNTKASIDHDCKIGDFVHIAPGVTISGGVKIGNQILIGAGSTIIQYKNISDNVIVAAGTVVTNDITAEGTYMGIPAKKVN